MSAANISVPIYAYDKSDPKNLENSNYLTNSKSAKLTKPNRLQTHFFVMSNFENIWKNHIL